MNKKFHQAKSIILQLIQTADNLAETGKYLEAIQCYSQVIDLNASFADLTYALYMRSSAYKAIGDIKKARNDWQKIRLLSYEAANDNSDSPINLAS